MRERLARRVRQVLKQSGKHALTYALVDAMLDELSVPEPRMLAAALPLIEMPTEEHWNIGRAAIRLLPAVRIEQRFMGDQAAADLARDWQIMVRAAQGTSASGQDRNGLEAKPAGPVAESDAP